jgi:asparagine synthase (glutamine-hydrolysing)
MSAIFGQLNFNDKKIQKSDLLPVENVLNHWQADDKGIWTGAQIGLGHLMLYNTPESLTEKLPFYTDKTHLTITADARIDNREELFLKLEIEKAMQTTIADSTLILKSYEKYGEDCVKHLIGDFAFAIWNEQKQELFCARDHMGIRPFFYYHDANIFAFATEKKGILVLPNIDQTIDQQFFYNQLVMNPLQEVYTTLYQHIKRIAPAHTLTVNAKTKAIKYTKYWTLDADLSVKFNNREEYYEGFLAHLKEAVKCRTRSHFKVGAQLSGGMDSSAITGVASQLMRKEAKELITLSNTLADHVTDEEITKLDERKYIDEVNKFNQIKETILVVKNAFETQQEEIDFTLAVNDGLERWNPNWLIPLKKAAMQNNIRTLLSGFPGDELVTYRGKYFFLDFLDKKQYFKYFFTKQKYPGFNKIEPFMPFWLRSSIHKIKTTFKLYDVGVKASLALFNIPNRYLKNRTASNWDDINYKEQFKSYTYFQRYRVLQPHTTHRMESEVRYGLYFRTEPRFPMADIRLMQYYLAMPNELKYEGTLARTAFRKALKDHLPQLILERDSKYGSIAPFLVDNKLDFEGMKALVNEIADSPLLKRDAMLERINQLQAKGKQKLDDDYKVRVFSKMPPMDLLKWIAQNQKQLFKELF